MVPIVLDVTTVKTALVGEGEATLRRLLFLRSHGAEPEAVFAPEPVTALAEAAEEKRVARWPVADDLAGIHVLFAAGLAPAKAEAIAAAARSAKTLLNVEDVTALCDVHVPATVRRGDLLLTASTGGRAPGLARRLGRWLADAFGPEWDQRLDEIAALRGRLRAEGASGSTISRETDRLIEEKGWLS
jgi:precorrin-2 dehydrogenase/sirohydrochlorin ferrochelatase